MKKNEFRIDCKWMAAGNDVVHEFYHTMGLIALRVGNFQLMRNEDIWSETIRNEVLASAYPLALWLAHSWWRLNWEPLPPSVGMPSVDWRMAHEIGAANHGFVWPRIIFATDSEAVNVWSVPSFENEYQSVKYLTGLSSPFSIPLTDFQRGMEDFILKVLNRLEVKGLKETALWNIWQLVVEDRDDPQCEKYRRLEAEMGYDPDECPENLMRKVLELEKRMGTSSLHELAPLHGLLPGGQPFEEIENLVRGQGLNGEPSINSRSINKTQASQEAPWQSAVKDAADFRQWMGKPIERIENAELCGFLGLKMSEFENWSPDRRNKAAIAVKESANRYKFFPRKKHPTGKRFELARFIGDYILASRTNGHWLASTDLRTSRQKYQRAFAAEFLCPIEALKEYLRNDFSESACEDAAEHFEVSSQTIASLLVNNNVISPAYHLEYSEFGLPYKLDLEYS